MRFAGLFGIAVIATVMTGVSAEDSAGQATEHTPDAADEALEHASDHSRLLRDMAAETGDAGASEGERCDEFENHGAYVSSVADDKPESADDADERVTLGSLVSVAAQSDIGKCGGGPAAQAQGSSAAEEHRAEQSMERPDERGRSAEARAEHPPQNDE